jgi:hypothetical protein
VSVERELLKEALAMLQDIGEEDLMMRIDAELAKPEPEPLCYLYEWDDGENIGVFKTRQLDLIDRADAVEIPLYTSQPTRKPLSDEEIRKVINWEKDGITNARAIEKAHGIIQE